jgi:hypothetical protein
MSTQVAQDLRAAAEVLRRDGWTRDTFTDDDGCHCVAGAVGVVTGETYIDRWREAIVTLAVSRGLAPWPLSVYRWNDAPERTADEVIAALEAAADAAEAQS